MTDEELMNTLKETFRTDDKIVYAINENNIKTINTFGKLIFRKYKDTDRIYHEYTTYKNYQPLSTTNDIYNFEDTVKYIKKILSDKRFRVYIKDVKTESKIEIK